MRILICSFVLLFLPALAFSQSTDDPANDPAYDEAIDEVFPDPGLEDPWITEFPDITIVEVDEWVNPIFEAADYGNWLDDILNETSPDNVFLQPDGWMDINPIDDETKDGDYKDAAEAIAEIFFEIYKDSALDSFQETFNLDLEADLENVTNLFDETHEIIIVLAAAATIEATTGALGDFIQDTTGSLEGILGTDIKEYKISPIIPINDIIKIGGTIYLGPDNQPAGFMPVFEYVPAP